MKHAGAERLKAALKHNNKAGYTLQLQNITLCVESTLYK